MAYASATDQQLVEQVKDGDKRAFNFLVIKYQRRVLGLIGYYVHDVQEVQDIAQEAFVKAYRALHRFRGDCAFYTWLYRIAINTAKNYLTTQKRKPVQSDVDVYDADSANAIPMLKVVDTPENSLYRDEIEQVVHATMAALPDDLRTALTLREFDGLSYDAIATVMACPVGTVRSRIFRARQAIDREVQSLL